MQCDDKNSNLSPQSLPNSEHDDTKKKFEILVKLIQRKLKVDHKNSKKLYYNKCCNTFTYGYGKKSLGGHPNRIRVKDLIEEEHMNDQLEVQKCIIGLMYHSKHTQIPALNQPHPIELELPNIATLYSDAKQTYFSKIDALKRVNSIKQNNKKEEEKNLVPSNIAQNSSIKKSSPQSQNSSVNNDLNIEEYEHVDEEEQQSVADVFIDRDYENEIEIENKTKRYQFRPKILNFILKSLAQYIKIKYLINKLKDYSNREKNLLADHEKLRKLYTETTISIKDKWRQKKKIDKLEAKNNTLEREIINQTITCNENQLFINKLCNYIIDGKRHKLDNSTLAEIKK